MIRVWSSESFISSSLTFKRVTAAPRLELSSTPSANSGCSDTHCSTSARFVIERLLRSRTEPTFFSELSKPNVVSAKAMVLNVLIIPPVICSFSGS